MTQVTHPGNDDSHRTPNYYPRMTSPTDTRTVTLGLVQMRCTSDPAQNMKKAGLGYAGISMDGYGDTNDKFRGKVGAGESYH